MAGYSVRSLKELSQAARGYFTQAVEGAIASVWANTFTVFGKVLALIGFEIELRRKWLFKQIFASSADEAWLVRHGYELGLGGRSPGTKSTGMILADATDGLVVPAGLQYQAGNGVIVTTLTEETANGNLVALPVEAVSAGYSGNLGPDFPLTLVEGQDVPDGLGTSAVVDETGLAGGADPEKLETYRARVLDRKRNPPQGGSAHDYAVWAKEALGPGILRQAYVGSFVNDIRAVWICFTVNDQVEGIPTDAQVALVQAYCDDRGRRPVTARAYVTKPLRMPVDIKVTLYPDNLNTRASVEAELAAEFIDRAVVGTAEDPAIFSKSWIDEAISRATDEDSHELVAPSISPVATAGYLPVLGTVEFVPAAALAA